MGYRLAQEEDTSAIAELLTEMREKPVQASDIDSQLKLVSDSPGAAVHLMTDEMGAIVGMAVTNLVYKLPKVECRIDEVIVANNARGNGYGTQILNACETWAWQNGADVIEFTSRASREAANKLYQKSGYQIRNTNVYLKKREDV